MPNRRTKLLRFQVDGRESGEGGGGWEGGRGKGGEGEEGGGKEGEEGFSIA